MSIQLQDTATFFIFLLIELSLLFFLVSTLVGVIRSYALSNTSPSNNKMTIFDGNWGKGNIVAATFGAITPFCSCSTIPILRGLIQSNVRFGSVITFLFASPLLNPVVITMLSYMVGWQGAIYYSVLVFVSVVLIGMLWEKMGLEKYVIEQSEEGISSIGNKPSSMMQAISSASKNSLSELKSIFPYLLIGITIGSLIYGLVPADWILSVAGPDNLLAIPTAAVVGIPLYVRVETMIPIGVALIEKGMGIGAIIALIIGGSGASIPEISLLAKIFKVKLIVAFVGTVLLQAIIIGLMFQLFMQN